MKRRIIVKLVVAFLAILSLCGINASITAFAAENTTAYVSSNTEVFRGEEIDFTVSIKNGTGIQGIMIVPVYDNNYFDLIGGRWTITGGLMSDFSVSTGDGVIAFSSGISINSAVLDFTLKTKDNAAFGIQNVSAEVIITDSNGNSTLTTSGVSVQIKCKHDYSKQDLTYIKSEATCISPAVYYKSCVSCGEKGTETFEYGTTTEHSYTRQVITDVYKKSNATCAAKTVYYYCCATCDAKGTTTFEYGEILAHSYTRQVISDTYKVSEADCESKAVYNYCCATCDAKGTTTFEYGNALGHMGGTATCTTQAVCDRCNKPYGEMSEHVYTDEEATETYLKTPASCSSKAVYYKNCVACGKAGTETFEYGEKTAHVYIEKVSDAYLKFPSSCTEKAIYYKSCSVCGTVGTETFEAGEEPRHDYQSAWTASKTSHWHECSKCGDIKDMASHTAGAEATETTAQTCTVCNYTITPALGHTHNYSSQWTTDANEHWHSCTGCNSVNDKAEHIYTNDCDIDCNTCGYARTVEHSYKSNWSSNAETHWYECSICGVRTSEAKHAAGVEATETTDQICTVCGYVIKEALGHTHDYKQEWSKNSAEHWHECACGEKIDIAAHSWDKGVVTKAATETEEGIKTFTCAECGQTKNQAIAKIPVTPDVSDGSPIVWIVISAVVAVGALVAVAVVLSIRKKCNKK